MKYSLPRLLVVVVAITAAFVMVGGGLTMIIGSQTAMASAVSFKLSVIVPVAVVMANDIKQANDAVEVKAIESYVVQKQQAVRNNTPVTIQSTVVR